MSGGRDERRGAGATGQPIPHGDRRETPPGPVKGMPGPSHGDRAGNRFHRLEQHGANASLAPGTARHAP